MGLVVGVVCVVVVDVSGVNTRERLIGFVVFVGVPMCSVSIVLHGGHLAKPV